MPYTIAFGKSYFNPIASQNIKHGESFFVIEGLFEKDSADEKVVVSLKKGQKKSLNAMLKLMINKRAHWFNSFGNHFTIR